MAALGALSGPLHGGAPSRALDTLDAIGTPDRTEAWVRDAVGAGERIMGFGHAVYKTDDPRSVMLRDIARSLGGDRGRASPVQVEDDGASSVLAELKPGRELHTNVEFYAGVVMEQCGLPRELFTPTFAASRVVGWCAHMLEQATETAIIRPSARYVGPEASRARCLPRRNGSTLGEVAAAEHAGVRLGHRLQAEPAGDAVGGEDALAAAEHDGLDHEVELVHEVVGEQRLGDGRAAHDVDVATRLRRAARSPSARARRARMIVVGDHFVASSSLSESDTTYFCTLFIQSVNGSSSPVRSGHAPAITFQVRRPAGWRRCAPSPADEAAHDLGIEERHRPSAVPEPAVGVLFRAAGSLHDAVEADELADHDSHAARTMPRIGTHRSAREISVTRRSRARSARARRGRSTRSARSARR